MMKEFPQETIDEESPVDDVRRIREKLSRETGNDVRLLAERSRAIAEKLREKLGLKSTEH
ncbi:MAG: hypothetical protein HYV26_16685 [Candidatus Hydrogenedentes bacterium]|nr:hypothetical protein [Candidatus Hydrogenedentota bacterium]